MDLQVRDIHTITQKPNLNYELEPTAHWKARNVLENTTSWTCHVLKAKKLPHLTKFKRSSLTPTVNFAVLDEPVLEHGMRRCIGVGNIQNRIFGSFF